MVGNGKAADVFGIRIVGFQSNMMRSNAVNIFLREIQTFFNLEHQVEYSRSLLRIFRQNSPNKSHWIDPRTIVCGSGSALSAHTNNIAPYLVSLTEFQS
jgi:hypothetical protein